MEKGIVCKVWNIKGSTGSKGAIDQLRDSVGYILNDEKTTASGTLDPLNQLTRECKYIENDIKTFNGALIGGNNISSCDVASAVSEMMEIKRFYGKEDGRAALHMIISLPEDESDTANATKIMQLADSVVKDVFPNNQAVYAVHTNTENLHIHVIVNSVGLDGKKIHQNTRFMKDVLHPCVNKYAAVYGFTQNPKWKTTTNDSLSFPEIKMMLRSAVDKAIERSDNFDDFVNALKKDGISVHTGKHISLLADGMGKAVRTHNLGSNYTRDAIIERILTRKEAFQKFPALQTAYNKEIKEVFITSSFKLPRYQDMSSEQKKNAIHMLRLGKNPWRENRQLNWQLNRIADDLNSVERIKSYVEFYAPSGSVQDALNGMMEAKRKVSYDKKLVTEARRKYKPILDIYEEMKRIEKKAYLYEYHNQTEYRTEHEQYRLLTKRLKEGYNKEVFEVERFLKECEERYLYDQAQINEISEEYRELRKYAEKRGIVAKHEGGSITDILDYFSTDHKMGIFQADAFYLSSPSSDVVIKVIKYPAMDSKGNLIEKYELTVQDRKGNVLREFSNENGGKEFLSQIKEIQSEYGLMECRKFQNFQLAAEYSKSTPEKAESDAATMAFETNNKTGTSNGSKSRKKKVSQPVGFTQAVNHVTEDKPVRVVVSASDPFFMALSSMDTDKNELKIVIFDQKMKTHEVIRLPLVTKKSSVGFLKLSDAMNKYGFSDEVKEFDNLEDAKKYCQNSKEETEENTRRKAKDKAI